MQVTNKKFNESYHQYKLDNGLNVVLWKKRDYKKSLFLFATPFGALDISQQNSNHEKWVYPSGIAHFLEHKMFAMKDNDVMNLFAEMQANVNAFTSYSETAYHFSTSSDFIKPLNLLLDFVQTLEIDEESVEKEKGIIIQELGMYDQISDMRLLTETFVSLFINHPLKNDIGGTKESVSSTTLAQLNASYRNNYHPSSMFLFGIGDFDEGSVIEEIQQNQKQKHFDNIPTYQRIREDEPRYVARKEYTFNMDVTTPKVSVAYKLAGISDPYERQMHEWCIKILLDQYFSTLNDEYQKWIDQEIINDFAGCEIDIGQDYGFLLFYGESNKLDEFVSIVKETMNHIINSQISEKLLEQLKRRYYGEAIKNLDHFEEIAIGFTRDFFDDIDYFKALEISNTISVANIDLARAYVKDNDDCIVYLKPNK